MSLFHLPIAEINERHLQGLIDAKTAEARDIEYKQATYGNADADHAEWLADLSSFANTIGGDIVIGMSAVAGTPTAFNPLDIDFDREILRLEGMARTGLQPRLSNLEFKIVPLSSGGQVLVVRTLRSYNPPHRVARLGKGQNRFWARSSAGKYEPNVDELRVLFTLAPQIADRMRDFRLERVAKIVGNSAPVKLIDNRYLIMHIVPFSSFDPSKIVSLTAIDNDPHAFAPMGSNGAQNWLINFDGLLIKANADKSAETQRAYTQVYRNGRIEAVASSIALGERSVGSPARLTVIKIEGLILSALTRYLKAAHRLNIDAPFAVMISLVGVKGVHINVGANVYWQEDDYVSELTEDQFHFSEVILDSIPVSIQDCARMIRPFIEQLANTAGSASSQSFAPTGEYLHAFR